LLVWAFLGNTLPTFIVVGLFLSFEPIIYLGQRFPDSTIISRLTPKNLLKLAIIILVAQILVKEVGKHFSDPTQLMGWTFVSLGVFVVVLLVIEQFSGKPWPETWIVRILGAASIVFFVAVAEGWLAIG
ncbi:MAG: hypothetical protein WCI12_10330, partial [Actinomycetes bacterium]